MLSQPQDVQASLFWSLCIRFKLHQISIRILNICAKQSSAHNVVCSVSSAVTLLLKKHEVGIGILEIFGEDLDIQAIDRIQLLHQLLVFGLQPKLLHFPCHTFELLGGGFEG
jgi:hypothetical protein